MMWMILHGWLGRQEAAKGVVCSCPSLGEALHPALDGWRLPLGVEVLRAGWHGTWAETAIEAMGNAALVKGTVGSMAPTDEVGPVPPKADS